MKTRISVQERLKDLRVERGLNLEELAQETGISKSALGSYENDNDEYKEINHGSLLKRSLFSSSTTSSLKCNSSIGVFSYLRLLVRPSR